jgi:hypothetical protein
MGIGLGEGELSDFVRVGSCYFRYCDSKFDLVRVGFRYFSNSRYCDLIFDFVRVGGRP